MILSLMWACGPKSPSVVPTEGLTEHAYGDHPSQRLDVYPSSDTAAPVLIYVHGGGWAIGAKENVHHKADWAREQGFLFVSVEYRKSPETPSTDPGRVQHPDHVDDVTSAIEFVREQAESWGGDPNRIGLMGHSAGGHLVALAVTEPGRLGGDIRCVFANDTGALDIVAALHDPPGHRLPIYENAFGDDPSVWVNASPISHLAPGGPDFLLTSRGTPDRRESVEDFAARVRDVGSSATVIDAAGMSHAEVNQRLGDPSDDRITPAATDFFVGCL